MEIILRLSGSKMYRIVAAAITILALAPFAWAEEAPARPTGLPKVTVVGADPSEVKPQFRLVKVETRPLGRRINVQIDPAEQYDVNVKIDPKLPTRQITPVFDGVVDQQNWFWSALSPRLADGDGARMQQAMAHLRNRPSGNRRLAPDVALMRALADRYGRDIQRLTMHRQVSPALVLAVMGVESAGKVDAVSSAGATGLMQLIPETAKRFGVREITDPRQNIAGGVAYLDWLLAEFGRDPLLALAGYNAGENAVRRHDGIPPYAETRAYVPKVVAAWEIARSLCQTPPDYVWQECVFQ